MHTNCVCILTVYTYYIRSIGMSEIVASFSLMSSGSLLRLLSRSCSTARNWCLGCGNTGKLDPFSELDNAELSICNTSGVSSMIGTFATFFCKAGVSRRGPLLLQQLLSMSRHHLLHRCTEASIVPVHHVRMACGCSFQP